MLRTFVLAVVAAATVGAPLVAPAAAAGPGSGLAALPAAPAAIERVSFWARPFPYGYAWRNHCVKRVVERTPWGPRWRYVDVCHY